MTQTTETQNRQQPDYIQRIDELREDLVKDLAGCIRIRSVKGASEENAPFGSGVAEAYRYMLGLAEREGFATTDVDGYGGHFDFGPADAAETMGVLCHLDVVPEGSGWERDPFGGEVAEGVLYGRGTLDDKGPTMAAFYAMKALKDCGYTPEKRIRMILGLDEETGSTGMEKYQAKVKMPDFAIVPDSDFPLVHGEMGILIFEIVGKFPKAAKKGLQLKKITGGTAANMVPDEAKAMLYSDGGYDWVRQKAEAFSERTGHLLTLKGFGKSLEISAKGISAHGAQPWKGTNAITILFDFLSELAFNTPEINDFVEFYQEHLGVDFDGTALGCPLEDDLSGRLILNAGMVDLNSERVKLTVNIRCPISYGDEDVYAAMSPVLEKYHLGVVKNVYEKPVYFSPEDPTVQTLLEIYRRHTGDLESQPLVIGGGTYARVMEHAIAFGALYPGDPDLMHQKNECVRIDRLVQTAKIYADAMYELAVTPGSGTETEAAE